MLQIITSPAQIGLLLQSARKLRGLSQAELATRLGVSQSRLSKIEQDPATMSVEQLLRLCAQLRLEFSIAEKAHTVGSSGAATSEW